MTYFSNGTPDFATAVDRVRRLIPDVRVGSFLLSDAEIGLFCTGGYHAQSNDYLAAAECASAIADGILVDMSAGATSVSLSQQFDHWTARAITLRGLAARSGGGAIPFVGGTRISQKQTIESDSDRVVPSFSRTLGDAPGTSTTATGDW